MTERGMMNDFQMLPPDPWANNLSQRASYEAHVHMFHPMLDVGHYLVGQLTAEWFEVTARKYNDYLDLNFQVVYETVKASQPNDAIYPQVVERHTDSAKRMMKIATAMAEQRQRIEPQRTGPMLLQQDFFVGILLSENPTVDELLRMHGISAETTFRHFGLNLAPQVIEMTSLS